MKKEVVQVERIKYRRRDPKHDYLKFFPVVMRWAVINSELKREDLYMLLFLNSEVMFSRDTFNTYSLMMSFDLKRFERLVDAGWIDKWRGHGHNMKAMYNISRKGRRLCRDIYDKLNGDKEFSMKPSKNKMLKGTSRIEMRTAEYMKIINKKNREKRLSAAKK